MNTTHHLRRWAAAITLAALTAIGIAAAPNSAADDHCFFSNPLYCDDGWGDAFDAGFQPGDLVMPAGSGS